MPQGVVLLFDPGADAAVRALWDALEDAGIPSLRTFSHRRHQPHVSLVVADSLGRGAWIDRLEPFRGLRVELTAPAAFPGDGGFLVLAATPTRRLLDGHAALVGALAGPSARVWEHYLPDRWIPHCTLGGGLTDDHLAAGVRICHAAALPVTAAVARIGLVDSETGAMAEI